MKNKYQIFISEVFTFDFFIVSRTDVKCLHLMLSERKHACQKRKEKEIL